MAERAQLKQKLQSVAGTSSLLTVARLTGAGIGILLQVLIARQYGASELGTYYLALSLAAVVSIFMSMGYPWIVVPIVARADSGKDTGELAKFLRLVRKDIVTSTVLLCLPLAALIWWSPGFDIEQRVALLIGLATGPVFAVMRFSSGIANGLKQFLVANLPELLFRPLLTLIIVFAAVVAAYQLNAVSIVAINSLVTLSLVIWMVRALPAMARLTVFSGPSAASPEAQDISRWRKLALPMMFSTLFVSMFADLNLLIIGMIVPVQQAGVLGVCIKIAALLAFTVQIVHHLSLRDASDAHLIEDRGEMGAVIARANKFALLTSVGSLVAVILFGDLVLKSFGAEFQAGYYCLAGLAVAQIIRAVAGPGIQILMIAEKQRAGIPVYAVSIIVLVVSNIILVPLFGYEGVAAAVVLTTLFWCVWLNHVVRRETGHSISAFSAI